MENHVDVPQDKIDSTVVRRVIDSFCKGGRNGQGCTAPTFRTDHDVETS
jgi:hypothetical protein